MDVGHDLGTIVRKAILQPRVVQNPFQEACVVITVVRIPITSGDGLVLAERSPAWPLAHLLQRVTARDMGETPDLSMSSK